MTPHETDRALVEALTQTAALLAEIATEIADRTYTVARARDDLDALEVTGLRDALTDWIDNQPTTKGPTT